MKNKLFSSELRCWRYPRETGVRVNEKYLTERNSKLPTQRVESALNKINWEPIYYVQRVQFNLNFTKSPLCVCVCACTAKSTFLRWANGAPICQYSYRDKSRSFCA